MKKYHRFYGGLEFAVYMANVAEVLGASPLYREAHADDARAESMMLYGE